MPRRARIFEHGWEPRALATAIILHSDHPEARKLVEMARLLRPDDWVTMAVFEGYAREYEGANDPARIDIGESRRHCAQMAMTYGIGLAHRAIELMRGWND